MISSLLQLFISHLWLDRLRYFKLQLVTSYISNDMQSGAGFGNLGY